MTIAAPIGLTEAQRTAFERDGLLRVRRALAPDQVERLDAAVDRVWWDHRDVPPERGAEALHLLAFLGLDAAFLELVDHPVTLPLVVELLGWNIYLYHCHLDVHPPEEPEAEPTWMWHQDGGRQNLELDTDPRPRMSVKIAWFLSDCREPGRGNFRVIPGSHLRNTLPRPAEGGTSDPEGAVPVLAGPGDAVIFDRRLWHMRSRNLSDITRRALFTGFTFRWIRPRDDMHIPPELTEGMSPVRAQLLGAGTGAIGHWIPQDEDVPLRSRFPGR